MSQKRTGMGVVFFCLLIDMIGFGIIIPFLTYMVADLGAANRGGEGLWVALVMSAYAFTTFLFSPMWGGLSDRIGRRPVLLIGIAGNGLSFLAFGLSGSLEFALAVRLMHGFFNANIGVGRAFIADISEPHELARRQGLIGVAFGVGFSLGPGIGGLLSNPAAQSWGSIFIGTVFEAYPYLLPCAFAATISALGWLYALRALPESLPPEARTKGGSVNPFTKVLDNLGNIRRVMAHPLLAPILLSMTSFWLGFTIMHATFILYTKMTPDAGGLGFDEQANGLVFMFIGLIGIIVQGRLIGPLTNRFGSNNLMLVGFIVGGIGLTAIPSTSIGTGWWAIAVVTGLVAIGNGLVSPSNMALLSHHAPGDRRGLVMGVSESLRALSSMFGVLIGGLVWDKTHTATGLFDYHTVFWISGACAFMAAVLFRMSKAWHAPSPGTEGESE